uniref:Uncharacterized protein n=1 Tax=Gorilla gorilla gorilla TaxID=9595 RepID=A0A2I2Z7R0_GORGO
MRQPENTGQHHTLQFTLPSSCANWNHPLAVLVVGVANPLSSSRAPSEKGLMSHSSFLLRPLAGEQAVCGWADTWEESPSQVHSTHVQCTQRNDMEIDAGRPQWMLQNVDWGKGFFILFFILLIMFLGDGRWCVFFSSWFSFAQAHKRDFCLLYHEQRNCPHTVNHKQCCCCFFKQYIWWSLCLFLFPVGSSGFSFVFKKNSKKD